MSDERPITLRSYLADYALALGGARRQLPLVVGFMILSTLVNVVAVGVIAPFLSVLLGQPIDLGVLERLFALVGLDHWSGFEILGSVIILVYLLKGFVAYVLNRRIVIFAERRRAELMQDLLRSFQYRPYEYHLHHSSHVLINKVTGLTSAFANSTLRGSLSMLAEATVFLAIAAYLAWSDWLGLLVLSVLLAGVFVLVSQLVRKRLAQSHEAVYRLQASINADVAHSLVGLREVRILGREDYFRARVDRGAQQVAEKSAMQSALQLIPRSAVEATVVTFLVVFAFVVLGDGQQGDRLLPLLGTFAVAGVRLMPMATSLLNNFNSVRATAPLLAELADDLRSLQGQDAALFAPVEDVPAADREAFRSLELRDVSFQYDRAADRTLSRINLQLQAGQVLGIIGRSGAGKSTLADLMIGLLTPASGTIRVNGWDIAAQPRRWQQMLAYIPQSIYLMDDTLRRNIALGLADAEVDEARIRQAVAQAQLSELVDSLPAGLDTPVGERGVRLSGGQRQRLAIARSLYFGRQVLILDEATSSLDTRTEQDIVAAIEAMHGTVTLVLIAHRLSTLHACDQVVRLEQGQLIDAGPPAEVFARAGLLESAAG